MPPYLQKRWIASTHALQTHAVAERDFESDASRRKRIVPDGASGDRGKIRISHVRKSNPDSCARWGKYCGKRLGRREDQSILSRSQRHSFGVEALTMDLRRGGACYARSLSQTTPCLQSANRRICDLSRNQTGVDYTVYEGEDPVPEKHTLIASQC